MVRQVATEPVYLDGQTEAQRHHSMQGHCRPVKDHFNSFSVLIDDQVDGSRKVVIQGEDRVPLIKVGDGAYWAYKWDGERVYRESWYY
jgi:hypothetical protein